jgi:hypothetical protein
MAPLCAMAASRFNSASARIAPQSIEAKLFCSRSVTSQYASRPYNRASILKAPSTE